MSYHNIPGFSLDVRLNIPGTGATAPINSYGADTSSAADAVGTSAENMVSTMSAVNVTAVIFLFISFPPNYFYWLYLPADAGIY